MVLLACSSKEAPSRILLWALSLMSFFEPQSEPRPRYRSGRLQEEQRLVAKTCSFFWRILLPQCPNFAELESSKEAKSYHENPCNRITGKKTSSSIPQRKRLDGRSLGWGGKDKKAPSPVCGSDRRSSQRALLRPKGDGRGKRNVPNKIMPRLLLLLHPLPFCGIF